MDNSKREGRRKRFSMLLLLFSCLTIQHFQCVVAASEDEYALLMENQGFNDDVTDSRSKLVSSLNHLLEQDGEGKRSSSFFPLRGKKLSSSDPTIADHYQFMSDHDDKRSQFFPLRGKKIPTELKRASSFMPMRGRKDEDWNLDEENINESDQDKRASSFMPMRGKKRNGSVSNMMQHFGKSGTYPSVKTEIKLPLSSENSEVPVKRMSAFVPVRGKKSNQEESLTVRTGATVNNSVNKKDNETTTNRLQYKRSISFTPMRGRRLLSISVEHDESSNPSGNIATSLLEKKQYAFMPMRGRRTSHFGESNNDLSTNLRDSAISLKDMTEFQGNVAQRSDSSSSGEEFSNEKKASSFMPMRGRRRISQDQYYKSYFPLTSDALEGKRESSFMPIEEHSNFFQPSKDGSYSFSAESSNKRASSFMPMRGRRVIETTDYSNAPFDDDYKRASSFMPMRGRRDKAEDLFNTTLDNSDNVVKRLSFMPMRGHRLPNGADENSERTKKKSFAFMPMRGRRFPSEVTSDDLDDSEQNITDDKRGYAFMPMRGRRWSSDSDHSNYYNAYPYFIPAGIGSALISRPFSNREMFITSVKSAAARNRRLYDWDSVKRAFHATRGKRFENEDFESPEGDQSQIEDQLPDEDNKYDNGQVKSFRVKRNIFQVDFKPQRKYLALKRPMSFFATRGKRLDESSIDKISKLP